MRIDRRNTRARLALLAFSIILTLALYFVSRSPNFSVLRQQWTVESSVFKSHDYQPPSTGNYSQSAQTATSALNILLEQDIELSDLAGKGQRVSVLSALLEAIIEDPTIPRESFFGYRTQDFGWWRLSGKTYLPWGDRLESEVGIVMCFGQKFCPCCAEHSNASQCTWVYNTNRDILCWRARFSVGKAGKVEGDIL